MQEVKKIIFIFFFLLFSQSAFAIEDKAYFDLFSVVDNVLAQGQIENGGQADYLIDEFQLVINKTKQGNPHAAREDLKKISLSIKNDYQKLNFAKFLYSSGYFSFAEDVLNSIKKTNGFRGAIQELRQSYAVKYQLSEAQENFLQKTMSLIHQENMPQEASFNLNKDEELINNSDYANYVMACAFYALGQYDKSLQYIKTAISINKANLFYRLYFARVYNALGEHKKAIEVVKENKFGNNFLRNEFLRVYYEANSKLAKNVTDRKYFEALIYYLNNDFYGAIETVRAGLLTDDKNLKLNHLLFKCLLNTGDVHVAQKIADKMRMAKPKSPYVYDVFGDLDFISANYLSACKNYSKATKLGAKEVYLKLILINTILSKSDKTDKLQKQASKISSYTLDENFQIAIGILSNANVFNLNSEDQKEYKNAHNSLKLRYLAAALAKNPCNSFYLLNMVDSIRGSEVKNLKLLELATILGDFNFYYWWKLGEFEDVIGNKDKAFEYYKNSANLNPRFEPVNKIISNINL